MKEDFTLAQQEREVRRALKELVTRLQSFGAKDVRSHERLHRSNTLYRLAYNKAERLQLWLDAKVDCTDVDEIFEEA